MKMTSITYLTGDATAPIGDGPKIIAHVVNDIGVFGAGFALAVAKKWPEVKKAYKSWPVKMSHLFGLGRVLLVPVGNNTTVMNMCAQRGVGLDEQGEPPIRYASLKSCLHTVASQAIAQQATVHMPRIGCGLAGGEWSVVEEIIEKVFDGSGVNVFVYDLPK